MSGSTSGGLLAAYGGMAADPTREQQLEAMRMFPYKFITQQELGGSTAPAASQTPGYDVGGAVDGNTVQQLIDAGLLPPGTVSDGASGIGGLAGTTTSMSGAPSGVGNAIAAGASSGPSFGATLGGLIGGNQTGLSGIGSSGPGPTGAIGSGPSGSMTGTPGSVGGPNVMGSIGSAALGLAGGLVGGLAGPIGSIAGGLGGKYGGTTLGNSLGNAMGLGTSRSFGIDAANPASTSAGGLSQQQQTGMVTGNPTSTHDFITSAPAGLAAGFTDDIGGAAPAGPSGPASGNQGAAAGSADQDDMSSAQGDAYAIGGVIRPSSTRGFLRDLARGSGLVKGMTAGRADAIHTSVPRGSYVMPADVVSGLGQGNTMAGARYLTGLLGGAHKASPFKNGGRVEPVPVRLSAGEFVVHPKHAAALGQGSVPRGHAILDQVVSATRHRIAQQALTAAPPK